MSQPIKDRLENNPFKALEQVSHCQGYLKGLNDAEALIKEVYSSLIEMKHLKEQLDGYEP